MAERTEWIFQIEGMTCDHSAKTIYEPLRRIPGVVDTSTSYPDKRARVVKEAAVKLDEKRAIVQYDPARVTPQQMADAVIKAGYKATVVSEQAGS